MNNNETTQDEEKLDLSNDSLNVLASRASRFLAALIDGLIVMMVTMPAMYFTGGFDNIKEGVEPSLMYITAIGLLGLLTFFIVNAKLLVEKGQTIGKNILDIKIVDLNNNLPTKNNLLKRYLVYIVPQYIPAIGGFLSIINILFIFGKERRCIHDLVGKTKVIKD